MTKRKDCELDATKRIVSPCWALEAIIDGCNGEKRKGAFVWECISIKTGQVTARWYGIKGGEHVKKGVVFNHCPFCATQIFYSAEELAAAKAA